MGPYDLVEEVVRLAGTGGAPLSVAIGEGPARLTLELANLANSDSLGDADDFVHQLAIGATSFSGGLIYGLSLAVLLDSVVEDDVDGVIFGVIASIAQKF